MSPERGLVADAPDTSQLTRPVSGVRGGVLSSTQGHMVPRRAAVAYDVQGPSNPGVAGSSPVGRATSPPGTFEGEVLRGKE